MVFFGRSNGVLRDGGRVCKCECFSRSSLVSHADWLMAAVIYSINLPHKLVSSLRWALGCPKVFHLCCRRDKWPYSKDL